MAEDDFEYLFEDNKPVWVDFISMVPPDILAAHDAEILAVANRRIEKLETARSLNHSLIEWQQNKITELRAALRKAEDAIADALACAVEADAHKTLNDYKPIGGTL